MMVAKGISSLPTEQNNLTWSALQTIDSNIPKYAKGICICNGGDDMVLMGADYDGNFIYGFRNNGNWDFTRRLGKNKVIWSGCNYMHLGQTCTLIEPVDAQPNGIVLVWVAYDSYTQSILYCDYIYTFVPKWHVNAVGGCGVSTRLSNCLIDSNFITGTKYVYVSNTTVMGYESNDDDAYTQGGVTRQNNYWVLSHIIGV